MKHLLALFLLFVATAAMSQVAENDDTFIISGTGFNGPVYAMAVQPDEKIVVAGNFTSYNGTTRNYIARLNADGTLDDTFDAGTLFGSSISVLAIDAEGRIVCSGSFFPSVKRLTSSGTNDGTFALTGTGLDGYVNSIAIAGDGTLYVGGNFIDYNGTSRKYIARLLEAGGLDTGFDPGTGLDGFVRKIGIQSDGKIVVVGGITGFSHYNGDLRENIVRIQTTGEIDATFVPPFNLQARMYDVKFQSDDKIIVTGEYNGDNSSVFNGVARLNTDGSFDNTFNAAFTQGGRAILIQADGKILVGGIQPSFPSGIRRLNTDGTTDPFFAGDGFAKSGGAEIKALVLQNGKILAGGDFAAFNGTSQTNMVRITSCSSAAITTQPQYQTTCATNTVSFSVTATGTGGLTYQWQSRNAGAITFSDLTDGAEVSGSTTATLTIIGITIDMHSNAYRCVVTDDNCATTSSAAILTVTPLPVVDVHPTPSTVCEGLNTTFAVTVTDGGVYRWQEDAGSGFVDITETGKYTGVYSATLAISNLTTSMTDYKYRCRVGQCTPSMVSDEALLTVTANPVITAQPTSVTICNGSNAQFSVTATGATTYQWRVKIGSDPFIDVTDGGVYSGATTSTLIFTGATTDHSGTYMCVVSGTCSTSSATAGLGVSPVPSFTTHPDNATFCIGSLVTFHIETTPVAAYQWQEKVGSGSYVDIPEGGLYTGTTGATLVITGITADMDGNRYRCVAGACTPTVTSFDADLTVYTPVEVITHPEPLTLCPGADATFTAAAVGDGNVTYQWQENPATGFFSSITDGGSYSGTTSTTLTVTNLTTAKNGYRYRCLVSNAICSGVVSNSALLTVPSDPSINGQPVVTRTFCETGSTSFSVTLFQGGGFQWQVDEGSGFADLTDGGAYSGVTGSTLSITNAITSFNGYMYRCKVGQCPASQLISNAGTLIVNETPAVTADPADKSVCVGANTTFEVTASGSSLTYRWRVDGEQISDNSLYSGTTTPTLTITSITANLDGNIYSCQVGGAIGCEAVVSGEAILSVPSVTFQSHPTPVAPPCEGGNASYSVIATGPDLSYQWQTDSGTGFTVITNGGIYAGATTANLSITGATLSLTGDNFRCVVTSGDCPGSNSNSVTLIVNEIPAKPIIVANLSNPEAPSLSTQVSAQSYKWFKDGTQVSENSVYLAAGAGSYTVKVTNNGCESVMSDAKIVIVTGTQQRTENSVLIYPNPVVDALVVSLRDFDSQYQVDITLVDVLGRTMERTSGMGGQEKQIDVSRFAAGRYVIRLQQGQQNILSQFIKKNH